MVLDTSAVIAILLQEPEAQTLADIVEQDPVRLMSAVNWLETQLVLGGRFGTQGRLMADSFFRESRVELVGLDTQIVHTALDAWRRYGKGQHRAALNLGDCCAYATAILKNQPLLFKGNDFKQTDVSAAAQ